MEMDGVQPVEVVNQIDATDPDTFASHPRGRGLAPLTYYRADPEDPASPSFVIHRIDPAIAIALAGGFEPPPDSTAVEFPDGRGWFDTLGRSTRKFVFERGDRAAMITGRGLAPETFIEIARVTTWTDDWTPIAHVEGFTPLDNDRFDVEPYATLTYELPGAKVQIRLAFATEDHATGDRLLGGLPNRSVAVRGNVAAVTDHVDGWPASSFGSGATWYEADAATMVQVDVDLTEGADPQRAPGLLDQVLEAIVAIDEDRWADLVRNHPPTDDRTWSCDPAPGACRHRATEDLAFCAAHDARIQPRDDAARQSIERAGRGDDSDGFVPIDTCGRALPPVHYRRL